MNRTQRRVIARASRRLSDGTKNRSYHLQPQRCTLWVAEVRGYVESFSATGYRVVASPELAHVYIEDEATSAAMTFQEITGLRVAIRPAHAFHMAKEGAL